MMNHSTNEGVTLKRYDFSHGSSNPYTIGPRHGLIPPCFHCGGNSEVTLDGTGYYQYFVLGSTFDKALAELTADEREVLISGTHIECWDAMMGEEED